MNQYLPGAVVAFGSPAQEFGPRTLEPAKTSSGSRTLEPAKTSSGSRTLGAFEKLGQM